MKKIILILLLIVYTSATFGIGVNQFYCCNKLKSISIAFIISEEKNCGMNDKIDNCCKTKYQFFKVKDSHFSEVGSTDLVKGFSQTDLYIPFFEQVVFTNTLPTVAIYCNPPPLRNNIPIYLLGSVFRI